MLNHMRPEDAKDAETQGEEFSTTKDTKKTKKTDLI
jgi:hypothetical protein